jgi:ferritin-like metal-binding protein YciE
MAKLTSLRDLLVEQLQDLYDAEHQLTEALPKMAQAARNPQIQQAFTSHLAETQRHISRLEQVFQIVGVQAQRKTCKAMKGLIEEGNEVLKEDADADVKDAALIAAGNRVEHYEIAGYGTVRTFTNLLGLSNAGDLLQQTLDEEYVADEKLTQIAESRVNQQAK